MLQVDACFKQTEIEILESSKRELVRREYCEPLKHSLTTDALVTSVQTQMQMAQVSAAMTVNDLGRVRTLERTKALLLAKLDRAEDEEQVEEVMDYIVRVERQIAEVMETYSRGCGHSELEEASRFFKSAMPGHLSEFHPLNTPLRIDLPSYQNT